MNVRLILGLWLFSHLPLGAQHAEQVKTLSDLKNGDWFTLEYTQFNLSPAGKQSLGNADIFEYLITMTGRTHDDLFFSITPTRVRFHETVYTDKEKAPKSGIAFNASMATMKNGWIQLDRMRSPFMHGGAYRAGYFHYFDSYYCNDFVQSEPVYVGSNDVVTFKLNLQTGLLSDTTYLLDKEGWLYTKEMIFDGIKKKSPLFTGYSSNQIAAKPFFEALIRNYFTNCNPRAPLPWLLEGQLANDTTYRVQMTGASFPLPPNVKLSYHNSEKLPAEALALEVNERKYELQQDDNGRIRLKRYKSRTLRHANNWFKSGFLPI